MIALILFFWLKSRSNDKRSILFDVHFQKVLYDTENDQRRSINEDRL
jgi:hypothetical protein